MKKNSLNIVHISSECAPYAKVGGLGDVIQQLPGALAKEKQNVCTIIPFYGFLKNKIKTKEIIKPIKISVRGKSYKAGMLQIIDANLNHPVFVVENYELFGRFGYLYTEYDDGLRFMFFDIAVLSFVEIMAASKIHPFEEGKIDILHCHDWHSGLIPELIRDKKLYPHLVQTATNYTIHNLAFQGQTDWWKIPRSKRDSGLRSPLSKSIPVKFLNFTKRAILYADSINTVSERYALEILTNEFGQGLTQLLRNRKNNVYGIINGVDYNVWNPQVDKNVFVGFNSKSIEKKKVNKRKLQEILGLKVNANTPLIGLSNRLTEQKGFGLIMEIMNELLKLDLQIVIVGSGEKEYLNFFNKIAKKYPKKVGVSSPFTESVASKVYAGSDMYLMPSHFEPCGISQMISLRYGAVPIVHGTGGLHDTIFDVQSRSSKANGFVFSDFNSQELLVAIVRACDFYQDKSAWKKLMLRGMKQSFSWDIPASKYIQLYEIAMHNKHIKKSNGKNGKKIFLKKKEKKYVLV